MRCKKMGSFLIMNDNNMRYGFGKNWASFIDKDFNAARLDLARRHLLGFLKLKEMNGLTFVDIGCGSGLHSLAAFQAGAEKIVSIDYDDESVKTTRHLHEQAGSPENWMILNGSVLDIDFMRTLGRFDIVYSWGVLHHTGEMWRAMDNVAGLMKDDGLLYISLYTSDVFIVPSPEFWLNVKRLYNKSGDTVKTMMELAYASVFAPGALFHHLKKVLTKEDAEVRTRGMAFWTDVRDWLGGWPMEFARISEVKQFYITDRSMELLNIHAGEATTEYLFGKKGYNNHWNKYLSQLDFTEIYPPFLHEAGHAWSANISNLSGCYGKAGDKPSLMLYEDDIPLGFQTTLKQIRRHGAGRYTSQDGTLIFASTDNTDPNTNGRSYKYCLNETVNIS